MQVIHESINKEHLPLKLNLLEEKSARYDPRKDFVSRCIKDHLIPNSFKLESHQILVTLTRNSLTTGSQN